MANNYRSLIKTVSFNKKTEKAVLDFVNAQENFSDTVLFLIQKEICTNGISNLQQFIPSARTIADVQRLIAQGKNNNPLAEYTLTDIEESAPSTDSSSSDVPAPTPLPVNTSSKDDKDSKYEDDSDEDDSEITGIPPELMI